MSAEQDAGLLQITKPMQSYSASKFPIFSIKPQARPPPPPRTPFHTTPQHRRLSFATQIRKRTLPSTHSSSHPPFALFLQTLLHNHPHPTLKPSSTPPPYSHLPPPSPHHAPPPPHPPPRPSPHPPHLRHPLRPLPIRPTPTQRYQPIPRTENSRAMSEGNGYVILRLTLPYRIERHLFYFNKPNRTLPYLTLSYFISLHLIIFHLTSRPVPSPPKSITQHKISYILHPTPSTLHPPPSILHPTPYTPYTSYILHPTSYT